MGKEQNLGTHSGTQKITVSGTVLLYTHFLECDMHWVGSILSLCNPPLWPFFVFRLEGAAELNLRS